jgi:DNA polymerase III sliding clamp (beta) subunit (PCNA family)
MRIDSRNGRNNGAAARIKRGKEKMKIICRADYVEIVSRFVGDEETRHYLSGVYFEKHPKKGVVITATNGHILASIYDENGTIVLPPKQDGILLPISKGIKKAIKETKFKKLFSYNKRIASVVNCDLSNFKACAKPNKDHLYLEWLDPIDGNFPDWRRVLPKGEFKPVNAFNFNPEYLSMFSNINGNNRVAIFCMDEVSPSLVKIPPMPEFLGVLMPMRVGGDSKYPDWIQK